jgi:hypothetical protein
MPGYKSSKATHIPQTPMAQYAQGWSHFPIRLLKETRIPRSISRQSFQPTKECKSMNLKSGRKQNPGISERSKWVISENSGTSAKIARAELCNVCPDRWVRGCSEMLQDGVPPRIEEEGRMTRDWFVVRDGNIRRIWIPQSRCGQDLESGWKAS